MKANKENYSFKGLIIKANTRQLKTAQISSVKMLHIATFNCSHQSDSVTGAPDKRRQDLTQKACGYSNKGRKVCSSAGKKHLADFIRNTSTGRRSTFWRPTLLVEFSFAKLTS